MSDSSPGHPGSTDFPTTQWSRVLAAGDHNRPEATEALCALCRDYWYPLYDFVRRKGHHADEAQDLVQGFFAALLERDALKALTPERGRFRSFLMACCENYLGEHRAHQHALKRGGGRTPISIDHIDAESRFKIEPSHDLTPERLYERRWAQTVLERALSQLDAEATRSSHRAIFVRLRPGLLGLDDAATYRQIGEELGKTEAAVKMAAHRLRSRYRTLIRDEIARTVPDPADIDDEIAALMAALAS